MASSTHLVRWDIGVSRNWSPIYLLAGERYQREPIPPIQVNIAVEFDENQAALESERKVREILEEMG